MADEVRRWNRRTRERMMVVPKYMFRVQRLIVASVLMMSPSRRVSPTTPNPITRRLHGVAITMHDFGSNLEAALIFTNCARLPMLRYCSHIQGDRYQIPRLKVGISDSLISPHEHPTCRTRSQQRRHHQFSSSSESSSLPYPPSRLSNPPIGSTPSLKSASPPIPVIISSIAA